MRLISLKANQVFDYLTFSLRFRKDLTFLTGINGSGKTTALRLIWALLMPSMRQLDRIPHESVELVVENDGRDIAITSRKTDTHTVISVTGISERLEFPTIDPRQFQDRPRPEERVEEHYSILESQLASHPVMAFLRDTIDTPIFLGIERRHTVVHPTPSPDSREAFERERLLRFGRRPQIAGVLAAGLTDIQVMLQTNFRRIREEQDRFSAELRTQILLSAFDYTTAANVFASRRDQQAAKRELSKQIRDKRTQIERALLNLGVDQHRFEPVIKKFFDRVDKLSAPKPRRKSGDVEEVEELFELAMNRPLIDRVIKLVELFDAYTAKVDQLFKPSRNFLSLVNRFFADTGKELFLDPIGRLRVRVTAAEERTVDALSSGERQIVIMLGYLAINRELDKEGIFIVDEPELSLHLKWQEMFVDSLLEASPKHQFILATHSPAIVLDRTNSTIEMHPK